MKTSKFFMYRRILLLVSFIITNIGVSAQRQVPDIVTDTVFSTHPSFLICTVGGIDSVTIDIQIPGGMIPDSIYLNSLYRTLTPANLSDGRLYLKSSCGYFDTMFCSIPLPGLCIHQGVFNDASSLSCIPFSCSPQTVSFTTYVTRVSGTSGCISYNSTEPFGVFLKGKPSTFANFSIAADLNQPQQFTLTDLSLSRPGATYDWSWGDGTHDTTRYPSHVYADSGSYTVCLTITDQCVTDTYCDSSVHGVRAFNVVNPEGKNIVKGMMVKVKGATEAKLVKPDSSGQFVVLTTDTDSVHTTFLNVSSIYTAIPSEHYSNFTSLNRKDSTGYAFAPELAKRDIRIKMYSYSNHRPGQSVIYYIDYSNAGSDTVAAGRVIMVRDSNLIFTSASPVQSGISGDSIIWDYTDLAYGEKRSIAVYLNVPPLPTVSLGQMLYSRAILEPLLPNQDTLENYAFVNIAVRGSYDPNDKQAFIGDLTSKQVANGQYLTYMIRFQNTGNDTAFKVVIRDTLDNNLDVNTLEVISASHAYEINLLANNVLAFTFNHILLADSNVNEPASHGYITYRVKPKNSLLPGATISNTAHIYFDFNLPVVTNTTLTTVTSPVAVEVMQETGQNLFLYPNPAKTRIYVYTPEAPVNEHTTSSIVNVLGKVVQEETMKWTGATSIDIKNLPAGIYFIRLQSKGGWSAVKRFLKE